MARPRRSATAFAVAPFERLADPDDLFHCVDVVIVLAVSRGLHEALLGPVNELARRDVTNPRGLGRGETKAPQHLAVVRDEDLRERVARFGLRHRPTTLP